MQIDRLSTRSTLLPYTTLFRSKKLIRGQTVAVDSTTLEANAAMKSIVRRDTGEDWKDYLKRLMQEEGLIGENDEPTDRSEGTRLNSSHLVISYAVFCLKKKRQH